MTTPQDKTSAADSSPFTTGAETDGSADRPKVHGYLTKLPSGATVWLARLASENFAVKFTNTEDVVTAFTLSPEAMNAVIRTHASLMRPDAFVENGSYTVPTHWQAVINYVATLVVPSPSPSQQGKTP